MCPGRIKTENGALNWVKCVIMVHYTRLHGSVLPSKQKFTLALSRILSSLLWGEYLVPSSPPDASRLCAHGKGRGLTIKGEPCKCVLTSIFYKSTLKLG